MKEHCHLHIVQYLVETQHVNIEAKDYKERIGLNTVQYLCEHRANKQTKKDKLTPLLIASFKDYFNIFQYLIEQQNINKEINNDFGMTPLHYACEYENVNKEAIM